MSDKLILKFEKLEVYIIVQSENVLLSFQLFVYISKRFSTWVSCLFTLQNVLVLVSCLFTFQNVFKYFTMKFKKVLQVFHNDTRMFSKSKQNKYFTMKTFCKYFTMKTFCKYFTMKTFCKYFTMNLQLNTWKKKRAF